MDEQQIMQRAQELSSMMRTIKRANLLARDDSGLRNSEKYFLWVLASLNKGEPVKPSEAARELDVTLAAVTHYINSLEEQGYVVRSQSPNDRRVVLISLSQKGTEMIGILRKSNLEKLCGLVEYLGDKDSSELISLMAKVANYFNSTSNA